MAEVFAGSSMGSHGFQKPVAIKRLLPELATDRLFVERLICEAKLLVGMQHGNIVSVLDLSRDGHDVFLVMEFVDGPSVRQLMRSRGSNGLPLGIATYITQAAAAGLEFAHARPGGAVIHADISPSNLLLTTSGEVRVADFGIARREGRGIGVVEGKWAYMAPEQARGEALTPSSDVFALGVVLYELITGQHPLGRTITANERGSELRVIPPRVVKPSISVGLDAICMRALAADPRDRFARMQQLNDALVDERFSNGWREGASDLAQLIRAMSPVMPVVSAPLGTQPTDRNVTIVTRSLISSSARSASQPIPPPPPEVPYADPQRQSGSLAHGELLAPASVPHRNHRWTLAVLGAAAFLGTVAAVGIQLAPADPAQHIQRAAQPSVQPASLLAADPVPVAVPLPIAIPAKPALAPLPPIEEHHTARKARVATTSEKPAIKRPAAGGEGFLKATTRDTWAYVDVNGASFETPHTFKLAPGRYKVRFENDQYGIHKTCVATVAANSVAVIREDKCE
ncbi:MAG: hypothetical protein JWO36_7462 [Myxococcales bacterium]|nr:hypothetical protein [Myxococcales bacterium]